jgi:superfamily I DNA/RNA helicase
MKSTKEQEVIISSAVAGKDLAIRAYAGCGKSSTLKLISKELPKSTIYLAFNKSIADEMQESMLNDGSAWVTCQTINSLAWRYIVKNSRSCYGIKLSTGLSLKDIEKYVHDFKELDEKDKVESLLKVKELVTGFCNSGYTDAYHYVNINNPELIPSMFGTYVADYWNILINEKHPAGISHDVYVKLFELSKPKLPFDVVMVDEFQDLNECNLSIIYGQKQYGTQVIVVGDTNQEIFGFRSSVTAFKTLPDYFTELRLSESFRFTQEIADICTQLVYINGEDVPLVGKNNVIAKEIKQTAYICRTNLTVFELAFNFLENPNKKVHIIADLKSMANKLYHVAGLLTGKSSKYPDKELSQYATKADLLTAAEKQQDLKTLINLTSLLMTKGGVYYCLEKLKKETVSLEEADIVIATCHKLKGLGFDSVVVMEDFLILGKGESYEDIPGKLATGQTLELIYVAVSRAKYQVFLPSLVQYVIENVEKIRENYLEFKKNE